MRLRSGFLLLVIFVALNLARSGIAAENSQYIPVPAAAEEIKTESRKISGSEFEFKYYSSNQGASQIKAFYRNTLATLGWKESRALESLGEMPGSQTMSAFEHNLLFEKDGAIVIITFMPQGTYQDNKTRFTVAQGEADYKSPASLDAFSPPELLTTPAKDVAPVYPGASLLSLSEPAGSSKAVYFSKDAIETVASFYKNKMPNYGWALMGETPPEKITSGDAANVSLAQACPTCAQVGIDLTKPMELFLGELDFANSRGDTCKIGLSYTLPAQEELKQLTFTTIVVDYNEKR